jgi:transcriptional regulator GlxA family with amidase domain
VPWLRANAPKATRIVSVCSGAFLPAQAGLLDGHRATTHWSVCANLAAAYSAVEVDPEPIFVRDGKVSTSAESCGYGTSETMRRAFVRTLEVSPAEYRRRF